MEKKQSLDFLQKCIDSFDALTEKEVDEMRELYVKERKNSNIADFEILLPNNIDGMDVVQVDMDEIQIIVGLEDKESHFYQGSKRNDLASDEMCVYAA